LSPDLLSIKAELNKAIQNELKLRDFAGELLQRISATHRQCEADLRKLLVETKMNTLANIIDINDHSSHPGATIAVDIEQVAATIQTNISPEQRESLHLTCSEKRSWNEILKSWSGCPCPTLGMETSMEKKIFDQVLFSQSQLSTVAEAAAAAAEDSSDRDEETKMFFENGYNSSPRVSPRASTVSPRVMSGSASESFIGHPIKHIYKSLESESIRIAIKDLIAKQLLICSTDNAPNHFKVLIPVLQGMSGYVCGRLPSEAKQAISAYAESALGDQVRIMRCLLTIFLNYAQQSEEERKEKEEEPTIPEESIVSDVTSASLVNNACPTSETSNDPSLSLGDGEGDEGTQSQEKPQQQRQQQPPVVSEDLHLVSCSHVEDFLYWASSIGDIIGLQVRHCLNLPPLPFSRFVHSYRLL
jgi:hypothetical protein